MKNKGLSTYIFLILTILIEITKMENSIEKIVNSAFKEVFGNTNSLTVGKLQNNIIPLLKENYVVTNITFKKNTLAKDAQNTNPLSGYVLIITNIDNKDNYNSENNFYYRENVDNSELEEKDGSLLQNKIISIFESVKPVIFTHEKHDSFLYLINKMQRAVSNITFVNNNSKKISNTKSSHISKEKISYDIMIDSDFKGILILEKSENIIHGLIKVPTKVYNFEINEEYIEDEFEDVISPILSTLLPDIDNKFNILAFKNFIENYMKENCKNKSRNKNLEETNIEEPNIEESNIEVDEETNYLSFNYYDCKDLFDCTAKVFVYDYLDNSYVLLVIAVEKVLHEYIIGIEDQYEAELKDILDDIFHSLQNKHQLNNDEYKKMIEDIEKDGYNNVKDSIESYVNKSSEFSAKDDKTLNIYEKLSKNPMNKDYKDTINKLIKKAKSYSLIDFNPTVLRAYLEKKYKISFNGNNDTEGNNDTKGNNDTEGNNDTKGNNDKETTFPLTKSIIKVKDMGSTFEVKFIKKKGNTDTKMKNTNNSIIVGKKINSFEENYIKKIISELEN